MTTRKVVVTGGARGLGAAIARGYVEAGMQVALLDLREKEGLELAGQLGGACRFFRCDISSATEVQSTFERAAAALGGIDVLAAVAGLDRPGHAAEDIPVEVWDEVMGVNARGTFLTNKAAFPYIRESAGGRIINFASVAGIRGMKERAAYSAAKGAVLAWTRAAAQAWGQYGITVNAIAPQMHTEVAERYLARLDPEERHAFESRLKDKVPMQGRLGDPPHDLVPLMLFLAGAGAGFMTGQVFAVDGGMTMIGS